MFRSLTAALVAAMALLCLSRANAQGVTRVCTQSIGANGSNNCVDVSPGNAFPNKNGEYAAVAGFQQLSVGASAAGLTVPTGATIAEICAEGTVRYRDDGTAPTTTSGIPVFGATSTPSCFAYSGPLAAIKFIATTGTVTVDVSYYK